MPYIATRRLYSVAGKKISRYSAIRRSKKLYNEVSRDMAFVEAKYLKTRMHNA